MDKLQNIVESTISLLHLHETGLSVDALADSLTQINEQLNERLNALKENGISLKGISDGHHTFGELYYHRMVLFSVILNQNKDISWKSKQHHDRTMFNGCFICGIETPKGQYTYHYKMEYWDMFKVKELDRAPEWDGHEPSDIGRLNSLFDSDLEK